MTTAALVAQLLASGYDLCLEDGTIQCTAPHGDIPDEVVAELRGRKPQLLVLLDPAALTAWVNALDAASVPVGLELDGHARVSNPERFVAALKAAIGLAGRRGGQERAAWLLAVGALVDRAYGAQGTVIKQEEEVFA